MLDGGRVGQVTQIGQVGQVGQLAQLVVADFHESAPKNGPNPLENAISAGVDPRHLEVGLLCGRSPRDQCGSKGEHAVTVLSRQTVTGGDDPSRTGTGLTLRTRS